MVNHDSSAASSDDMDVSPQRLRNRLFQRQHRTKTRPYSIIHYVLYISIAHLVLTVIMAISGLFAARKEMQAPEHPVCAACPEGWIGFGSKCFYFSDSAGNWTFSQLLCASERASLVQIETLKEMNFLKRYKGPFDHWIGLRRESPNHSWKWTGNAGYNITFPIRGDGECAYLNDNGVSSGRIYTDRKWICSKPNNYIDKCQISLNPS